MKKILLMPNPYRDRGFQVTRAAESILTRSGAHTVISLPFHAEQGREFPPDMHPVPMEEGLKNCDVMICFGGDGTILHAAHLAGSRNIPILGVNTGNMGFMAGLESNELNLLPKVLEENIPTEHRMMIHVSVNREGRVIFEDNALNDAVITNRAAARVVQIAVACDGTEALRFDGDGVIIATPTGTTAYSMAAGGPLVEPTAKNIIITPICAHAMGIRPLVMMHNRVITVRIGRVGRRSAFLSVDGGKAVRIGPDDTVKITASQRTIRLLQIKKDSYYGMLTNKF